MDIRALFVKHCAFCGEERPVERPECLDGHGDECPEAFCALCGLATWGSDPADMARYDDALAQTASSVRT